MGRHLKIHGIVFRPCSLTDEDNEQVVTNSKYGVKSDFLSRYNDHIAGMQIVSECAKAYINKHWRSVKDWSGLNVIVVDNTGKKTEYYNFHKDVINVSGRSGKSKESDAFDRIMKSVVRSNRRKHNPVKKISKVVLDPTDGDLSMDINGRTHLWVDDETAIIIADYIEEQLKK